MPEPSRPEDWQLGTSLNGPMGLNKIKSAGIDCIELVLDGNRFNRDFLSAKQHYDSIVEKARELGLKIWSVHLPYGHEWDVSVLHLTKRDRILGFHYELLKLAAEWEIKYAVIHPSYEPIRPKDRQERLVICRQALKRLAGQSSELGIRLAAECLPRTCLGNTSDEMMQLLQHNQDLAVCCDVNHLLQETPSQFIQKLGERIVTLHISDNDGMDERHWMPGEGAIDWESVMQSLSDVGYNGPFMFEVKNPDPREIASYWRQLLERRGGGN